MSKTYDLIIIGAGPAGITASIYAARNEMDFLVLTVDIGGQAALSSEIENYTGYQFITGAELSTKLGEQIKRHKVNLKESEAVLSIKKDGDIIHVKTEKGAYKAKTIIVASGKRSRELNIPGEKEFKNKGLTYCATCDGPLFPGKDVVVVGGGNSAIYAAMQLTKIARHVYVMNINAELGGDLVTREKVIAGKNVTVLNNSEITGVFGDSFVEGVKYKREAEEERLSVQGVFVEVGLIPNSEFASCLDRNEQGEILVNHQTETNVPGILAAGDVTNVVEKQIIIAAGEGSKAALRVFRYLAQQKDD